MILLHLLPQLHYTSRLRCTHSPLSGCPIIFHGDARYGDGKVIIKDPNTKEMVCYDLRASPRPRKLWTASSHPRWEDHLIVSAPLPSHLRPPLPHAAHRPYLLVLRANNVLQRCGLVTGRLEQEINLQAATIYGLIHRFTEMVPDMERGWLAGQTTKNRRSFEMFSNIRVHHPSDYAQI